MGAIIDLEAERRKMLLDLERAAKGEMEPRPIKKTVYFHEIKQVGSEEDRVLRFVGSDETQDRDRDIIEVAGWELENYKKNPVFLWGHNYWSPPVGQALKVWKEDGRLVFDIKFATFEEYAFADIIYRLYKGGYLRAVSVGFIPKKWEQIIEGEGESRRVIGLRFTKQELLELSAVPVPSNPNALQVARAKGIDTALLEERLGTVKMYITRFDGGVEELDYRAEQNEVFRSFGDNQGRRFVVPAWVEEAVLNDSGRLVKGVVPPDVSRSTAPEDAEWSKPKLSDFTDESWDDLTDAQKRKIAGHYAWAKAMPPEKFGDLKLPHHRPGDGKVVWNGVRTAMGALLGARGGVDIPDGDRRKVYDHLASHYEQFDKEPPEFRDYSEVELKELFPEFYPKEPRRFVLRVDCDEECLAVLDESGNELGDVVLFDELKNWLFKAGAVLNRKNKERLQQAQALIQEVLDSAESDDDDDDKGVTSPADPEPETSAAAGPGDGTAPPAKQVQTDGNQGDETALVSSLMVLLEVSSEEELLHKLAQLKKPHQPGIDAQDIARLTADAVKAEIRRLQGKVD